MRTSRFSILSRMVAEGNKQFIYFMLARVIIIHKKLKFDLGGK